MTFHNRGVICFPYKMSSTSLFGRGLKVLVTALIATGIAFSLAPPGADAWAWYQSPVSPVSPLPAQTDQPAIASPTIPVITPTPALEPQAASDELPKSRERSTALLVAGGIVLAGLIVGAAVMLVRGQPNEESAP